MEKKFDVTEINILDYLKDFSGFRTPLSDFYIKTKRCRILGIYDENKVGKGFLLAEPGEVTEILFVAAENEDPSIKRKLLGRLARSLPSKSEMRWRILENSKDESFAAEFGFRPDKTVHLFRTVGPEDEHAEETIRKYEKLYSFVENHGYRAVSFNELTKAELRQIRNNPDKEFDSYLRPGVLMDDTAGGFSADMSFAALKDGKVAAYTIVRSPDGKSCIFEIICVAKSERNSGVFILPFLSSLKAIIASGAEVALFAIYDNNSKTLDMVKKRFGQLISSDSVQHNMRYIVK